MWLQPMLLSAVAIALISLWSWPRSLRRAPAFAMVAVAGGVAAVSALALVNDGGEAWRWAGWASVAALGLMRLVAPAARAIAYWAIGREILWLAAIGVELFIALQPGIGGERDRILVRAYGRALRGDIDRDLARLAQLHERLPAALRPGVEINHIWLLLLARRHRDAVMVAERLSAASADDPVVAPSAMPLELRVQLLGAYAALGAHDQLAAQARAVLHGTKNTPALTKLYRYAALVALATAGRASSASEWLRALGDTASPFVAAYWHAAALRRQGQEAAVEVSRAMRLARTTTQREAAGLLSREFSAGAASPALAALADEIEAWSVPSALRRPSSRATYSIMALCGGWSAALVVMAYGISDTGSLIRGGGGVQALVARGEWWRLLTASFVHVGAMHLIVNMVSLWSLGRIVERLVGAWRTAAVFFFAAVVGAIASDLTRSTEIAAGASGGVMGLLGALLVELRLRKAQAEARGISGQLAPVLYFVVVVQVVSDLLMPAADGTAHLAGLCGGAAIAWLLGARAGWGGRAIALSRALVLAFVAALVVGVWSLSSHGPAQWLGQRDVAVDAAVGVDRWREAAKDVSTPREFEMFIEAARPVVAQALGTLTPLPLPPTADLLVLAEAGILRSREDGGQAPNVTSDQASDHMVVVWFAVPGRAVGRVILPQVYLREAWPSVVAWMRTGG